jgi:hypothetical protein
VSERADAIGFLMMVQVKTIDWDDVEIAIPAFLTIVLMPFTYSIAVGIGAGFLGYVLIKLVRGKAGEVHPLVVGSRSVVRRLFRDRPDRAATHLSGGQMRKLVVSTSLTLDSVMQAPSGPEEDPTDLLLQRRGQITGIEA